MVEEEQEGRENPGIITSNSGWWKKNRKVEEMLEL